MASIYIFVIIISKLYYKKKLCLVILFKVNKSLKINFYYTIWPLGLAVYLQVKSNKKFLVNVKEIT